MTMVRCDACIGTKSIIGLGNIKIKCAACKGLGFKQCSDIANVVVVGGVRFSEPVSVDDKEQDKLNNDSLPSKEQKKIEQSLKMKEVWAKRKAKEATVII